MGPNHNAPPLQQMLEDGGEDSLDRFWIQAREALIQQRETRLMMEEDRRSHEMRVQEERRLHEMRVQENIRKEREKARLERRLDAS